MSSAHYYGLYYETLQNIFFTEKEKMSAVT